MARTTIDRVREVALALPGVTESPGEHHSFLVDASRPMAYLSGDGTTDNRLALLCAAPAGVPHEMAEAEPSRFFRPNASVDLGSFDLPAVDLGSVELPAVDLGSVELPAVDLGSVDLAAGDWLGVYLDGTGEDRVDWDEIRAILDEAHRTVVSGATRPASSNGGTYRFQAELWVHSSGSWHFVTVPADLAAEIRQASAHERRGFGSVRVTVTIGASSWDTSVFPDSERGTFLLPIKKPVRTKEQLNPGDWFDVTLHLAASLVGDRADNQRPGNGQS